jgi:hypothetical protein
MKADVPFLNDSVIEQEAEILLAEYARDREPILQPPVPIEDIVEGGVITPGVSRP